MPDIDTEELQRRARGFLAGELRDPTAIIEGLLDALDAKEREIERLRHVAAAARTAAETLGAGESHTRLIEALVDLAALEASEADRG